MDPSLQRSGDAAVSGDERSLRESLCEKTRSSDGEGLHRVDSSRRYAAFQNESLVQVMHFEPDGQAGVEEDISRESTTACRISRRRPLDLGESSLRSLAENLFAGIFSCVGNLASQC